MFYFLRKKVLLGLCFGTLLGLTITTATEVFAGAPQISAGRAHSLTLDVYGTASAWGENLDGQGVAPVPATGYVRIVAGSDHNLAIKADGTVVEWGLDVTAPPPPGFGLPLPTAKPAPLTGVIGVAGGAFFSAALLDTYTVVAWGDNSAGQTNVPATLTGVSAIAAGDAHILALKSDGTVVGWGDDIFSQATGGVAFTGITAVAAGSSHSLALKSDGTVVGWGDNTNGQTTIPAGLTGVTAIAANGQYSMALKSDGTVVVWGTSTGIVNVNVVPTALTNPATANVIAIAAGALHAMALKSDGTVVAWGDDSSGQVAGATGVNLGVVAAPADTTPPVITLNGTTPVIHSVGIPYVDAGATVTDDVDATIANLAGVSTVIDSTVGNYTVTYNHSDAAGNAAVQKVRTVNVVDQTPPVITINGSNPATTEGGFVYTDARATVTDNVDATITNLAGVSNVNIGAVGSYSVTYNHTDAAANVAVQKVRTVNVVDTTAPVITLTGAVDIYVEVGTAYIDLGATATDNVDANVTVSNDANTTVNTNVIGTYIVTYQALDSVGNAAVDVTRNVHVRDTTAPIIVPNPVGSSASYTVFNSIVYVPLNTPYIDTYATVTDNVDATITNLVGTSTVNEAIVGLYAVTYDYSDAAGNAAVQVVRQVVVFDATPPVITVTGAVDIYVEVGTAYIDLGATATDNVDTNVTVSSDANTVVNVNTIGTYVVTYTSTDNMGNTATATRNVHVRDTTAPVITLTGAVDVYVEVGTAYIDLGATATDNVDANVTATHDAATVVNTSVMGTYIVTYQALDSAGNAAVNVTRNVHVRDATAPVITLNTGIGKLKAQSIAAGDAHSLALKNDGTVVAWGGNSLGQTSVPTGLTNVTAIAAGSLHSLALKNDGTVVAWGYNGFGQTSVPTGLTGVAAIAAGARYSIALKNDGTVVAWGNNDFGQTNVPAGLTGVTAIAAGDAHSIALKNDGTVVAWGNNFYGQTTIPTGLTGVTAIAASGDHNLALKNDGTVVAWGDNSLGQTIVPTGLTNVTAIAAGNSYSLALKNDGTVVAWGDNSLGQTNVPTDTVVNLTLEAGQSYTEPGATATDNVDSNVIVSNDANTVVDVNTVGAYVVTYTATDAAGNTATGTRTVTVEDTTAPVIRLNLPTDPYQIPAGIDTVEVALGAAYIDAYATVTDNVDATITNLTGVGTVNTSVVGSYTITYNHSDASGNAAAPVVRTVNVVDRSVDRTPPVISLNTTTARIQQVAAGTLHSLALKNDGTVVEWGHNSSGQTYVPTGLTGVTAIAAGGYHNLALKNDGTVVGWGDNSESQTTIPIGLKNVKAIAAGAHHSLALKNDGTVVAWGYNLYGQTNVPTGLTGVIAIAAGGSRSLALKTDGTVVAWGRDNRGETNVKSIASGAFHSLTLKNDGTVVAWGFNSNGQTTVPTGLTNVTAIAAGTSHSLALKNDGTVVAWGATYVPAGLTGVTAIAAGGLHSIALKNDGTVVAWGANFYGQTDVPKFTVTDFTLEVGQSYTDPGATVTDNKDGTISTNLKGVGKVDTTKVGVYKVTYNAKDAAGNAASEVVRTVTVKAAPASTSDVKTCGNIVPMLNMNLMPMYALMLLGMLGLSRRRET